MKGLSPGVELLEFTGPDADGYFTVRMAKDGIPSGRFSFPKAHLADFKTEEALGAFLSRQADTMISRYGRNGERVEASVTELMTSVA